MRDQIIALGGQRLGCGRHRETYLRVSKKVRAGGRKYVYKFPNPSVDPEVGISANTREFERWRKAVEIGKVTNRFGGEYIKEHFSPCKLLPNGVLMMEYVDHTADLIIKPDWTGGWDCRQCGIDRHGNVKLYDYAE